MSFRSLPLLFLLASVAPAADLRTLAGKTISGTVTAVTEKDITLKTDSGPVSTPLNQVLAVDLAKPKGSPGDKYSDVRLLDDTVLHCKKVDFKGKEAVLTLPSGITMQLPMNYIVSLLRDAQDPQAQEVGGPTAKVKRDRLVILKDGELNALEGTFGEVDATANTIQFRLETGDVLPVPLTKVHGMIFYRLEAPLERPLCRVLDKQGNSLAAAKLSFDGKNYTLTTLFGARADFKAEALACIDFNMGKLTYLSDLEPVKVIEKSGAGLLNRYRKDVNLDGEPIMLGATTYAKGLSLHAYTELEYNLGGKYKVLKATLGVDQRVGPDSQALVTIICDGDKRFSEKISAKPIRPISINIKDVTTLKIIVSSRDFLDLYDHVTLADALVSQ